MKIRTKIRSGHGPYVLPEGFALVLLLVLLVASPAVGQERAFGHFQTTYPESFEAGVYGLNIVRNGPEGDLSKCVFTVEVFGKEQKLLGVSEMKFPTPNSSEMSLVTADGETYHTSSTEDFPQVSTFEHVGGDWYRMQRLCDTDMFDEERKAIEEAEYEAIRREDRAQMLKLRNHDRAELNKRVNECMMQAELTGNTSKTIEQLFDDHAVILGIFQSVAGELRRSLDIPFKQLREVREQLKEVELEQQSGTQSDLVLCGQGQEQFCNTDPILSLAADGECSGDGCGFSTCCGLASAAADVRCRQFTGLSCCGNTFCQITSMFCNNSLFGCRCSVNGWRFECRSTCV